MTPDQARASYARSMAANGEQMNLRRPGVPDKAVRGRIIPMFAPSDLVAATQQIGRKAVITADDMTASGFPLPLQAKTDRLVLSDGTVLTIMSADATTRRIAGELIAYELELKGA